MEFRFHRPGPQTSLKGRARECALLDGLIEAIRRGESRSLVLRGEAGIGKTALLKYLVESASDLTVVRAVGVESEMELAFASLHQLCAPLLDRLERLPARSVTRSGSSSVCRRVPRRTVSWSASPCSAWCRRWLNNVPLLCIVDDAQWLDQTSALTLAFVARRLLAEPVGLVFAAREPGEELRHVPVLEVRGLVDGDARALLSSTVQFALDERVRDRILAETRGNPLALLELPRGLTTTQLAGGFGIRTSAICRIGSRRVTSGDSRPSPTTARRLLLVAAAEPVGDPLLVQRACERLGIAFSASTRRTGCWQSVSA